MCLHKLFLATALVGGLTATLLNEASAQVLRAKSERVQIRSLVTKTVKYSSARTTRSKKIYCKAKVPGVVSGKGPTVSFTSFANQIRFLRARGSAGSALTVARQLQKVGTAACSGRSTSLPRATPTPTGGGSTGNFDTQGNVTAAGRSLFGIPSNLAANINTGATVYEQNCVGCHTQKTNRTFSNLRTATSGGIMLFTPETLSDATLAQITAYLSRSRP